MALDANQGSHVAETKTQTLRGSMARFLAIGFAVWFAATLTFRFFGQVFFKPDSPGSMALLFLAVAVLIVSGVAALLSEYRADPGGAALASVALVLPGILLDVFSTLFFRAVLPNLDPAGAANFGALMLWGYGLALVPALVTAYRASRMAPGR